MKVLIYSTYVPGGVDGTSNVSRNLIPALSGRGIDVTICASGVNWPDDEIRAQRSSKVRIYKSWFNNNADLCPGMFLYFLKNIKKYDVVQLDGIYNLPTIVGAYCARLYNVPYIICPRGAKVPEKNSECEVSNPGLKSVFFRLFSKRAMEGASSIVWSSGLEKTQLCEDTPKNRHVIISDAINAEDYSKNVSSVLLKDKLGIAAGEKFFLFLGRLSQEKGLIFLLDVWEGLLKEKSGARLVIAGPDCNGYIERVKDRVSELSIPESVIFAGTVTGDLKLSLLRNCECLLLPSDNESFGIVVLEALASGVPVISSRNTPWNCLEEHGFGKWLIKDKSVWKKAMLDIMGESSFKREGFAEQSHKWVSDNYSWSKTAGLYAGLYDSMAGIHAVSK
ncbi:MAG: glycosyltransferase [Candidatus Omnitrophota bacterium]